MIHLKCRGAACFCPSFSRAILLFVGLIGLCLHLDAQGIYYIRAGATGSGSSWTDAYGSFAAAGLHNSSDVSVRGNTYYVADGVYDDLTIRNPARGIEWIIIKKATSADHGDSAGWQDYYGNGQAVLGSRLVFLTSYVEVDGNGIHTVPSDNPDHYGFKVAHDSSTSFNGVIEFGGHLAAVSHVNLKYVHGYNTTNGDINNGTVMVRFYPADVQSYIKLQNCFFENCGKDGLQISRSGNILVERCYVKRLGLLHSPPPLPDVHGQTVQLFYGGDDIVFRYNFWEANEGQSLIAIAGNGSRTERVRFYGNLVFNKLSGTGATTAGFNSSGGIIGNAWPQYSGQDCIYIYNNTVVNVGGSYGGHAHFPMNSGTNQYGFNNLFYNCGGNVGASGFTAWGYHASGLCVYGGTNEQTGLTQDIFQNYTANDYRLASETESGLNLTSQAWWNAAPTDFFGYLDSMEDVYGRTRGSDGNWDRGAFEFLSEVPQLIALQTGWNWISFNVLPVDRSLDAVFGGILGQVEQVRTQNQSAMRVGGNWMGDLGNMDGIAQGRMYKLRVSANCSLTVTGTTIAAATPISLTNGWNWAAYYPASNMAIGSAMSSINSQVQQARSQNQSAIYNAGSWLGDLSQMAPGRGYTIRVSGPVNLIYPGE